MNSPVLVTDAQPVKSSLDLAKKFALDYQSQFAAAARKAPARQFWKLDRAEFSAWSANNAPNIDGDPYAPAISASTKHGRHSQVSSWANRISNAAMNPANISDVLPMFRIIYNQGDRKTMLVQLAPVLTLELNVEPVLKIARSINSQQKQVRRNGRRAAANQSMPNASMIIETSRVCDGLFEDLGAFLTSAAKRFASYRLPPSTS
jgi:hypothetical protein